MKINFMPNNSINFKANFVKIPSNDCKSFVRKYPKYFAQAKEMSLTNDEIITGIALHEDPGNISIDFRKNEHGRDIVEFMFEDPKCNYKKTFQDEMAGVGNFGTALYMFYYYMIERPEWIDYGREKISKIFRLQDLLKANNEGNNKTLL